MKQRKMFTLIALGAIGAPIVIGQIIRIPLGGWTIGDENSWVGFFGGYVGGIIGGIVAFLVARFQINEQYKKQIAHEENAKFISQMPALLKLRYELENMNQSLETINIDLNRVPQNELDSWICESTEMYEILEQNWSAVDHIDSIDLSVDLISVKYKYSTIYNVFTFDFNMAAVARDQINDEVITLKGIDFEKSYKVDKIDRELKKKMDLKQQIISDNALKILSDDIVNTIDKIIIILDEIVAEKGIRQNIRNGIY